MSVLLPLAGLVVGGLLGTYIGVANVDGPDDLGLGTAIGGMYGAIIGGSVGTVVGTILAVSV